MKGQRALAKQMEQNRGESQRQYDLARQDAKQKSEAEIAREREQREHNEWKAKQDYHIRSYKIEDEKQFPPLRRLTGDTHSNSGGQSIRLGMRDAAFLHVRYVRDQHQEAITRVLRNAFEDGVPQDTQRRARVDQVGDRAAKIADIFHENLDQIIMGAVSLAQGLIDLAVPQDPSKDSSDQFRPRRVSAKQVKKLVNEYVLLIEEQMGAASGRPPNNPEEIRTKILQAMYDLLKKNPDDPLSGTSIARQMGVARGTLYGQAAACDVDLEELRRDAHVVSRKP